MPEKLRSFVTNCVHRLTLIATIYQHVKKIQLTRRKSIAAATINAFYFVRCFCLLVALYTNEPDWVYHDISCRQIVELQLLTYSQLGTIILVGFFEYISVYLLFEHSIFRWPLAAIYELINVNVHDISHSNRKQWNSLRDSLSVSNWFTKPIDTKRAFIELLRALLKQEKFSHGCPVKIDKKFRWKHFPVALRSVRIKCFAFWIISELLGLVQLFLLVVTLSFWSILFSWQKGVLLGKFQLIDLLALLLSFAFLIRCLTFGNFIFAYIILIVYKTFKILNRNLVKLIKSPKEIKISGIRTKIFLEYHNRLVAFMMRMNESVSMFGSLFLYLTLPFNFHIAAQYFVSGFSTLSELTAFAVSWNAHTFIFVSWFIIAVAVSNHIHSCHRYFVPVQLGPNGQACSQSFRLKWMSYYERMNSDKKVASNFYGVGVVSGNNLLSFSLLYFMYLMFAVDFLRA